MGGAVLFEGAKESPAFRLMTQMVCVFPLLPFSLTPPFVLLVFFSFFQCRIFVGTCGFCDAEFEVLISWKEGNK
jgi:hypothetical protein